MGGHSADMPLYYGNILKRSIRNQEMNQETLFSEYSHQAMMSQFQETLYPFKIG